MNAFSISWIYDKDVRSHKPTRTDFANGGWSEPEYNGFDRVISTTHDGTHDNTASGRPYRYEYEFGANGQVAYLRDIALRKTYHTEYDMA